MMLIFGAEVMDAPKGWEQIEDRLMAEYAFPDFASAKHFVDAVSQLSEEENHHPDIHFGWGYVVIELLTHDEEKITELDYQLAEKISALQSE
jgi:4a-hydroxytetrahydrobiopterin dehydratase